MTDIWTQLEQDTLAETPTLAEQEQYYLDAEAYLQAETKLEQDRARTQRIAQCGEAYGRYISPETGRITHGVYHCGVWRSGECPLCFEQRLTTLRGAAHRAILDARKQDKKLHLIQADKQTVNKLTRGVNKLKYTRYPGDEFDTLLIAEDECNGAGEAVTYDDISSLDWETLADTPASRRMSGRLGKSNNAPGSKDDVTRVKVTSFVLHNETTKEQERTALKTAMQATAHLKPTTLAEVQRAVKIRKAAFIRALYAAGGKLLEGANRTMYVKCNLTSIDWKSYTGKASESELKRMAAGIEIPF